MPHIPEHIAESELDFLLDNIDIESELEKINAEADAKEAELLAEQNRIKAIHPYQGLFK